MQPISEPKEVCVYPGDLDLIWGTAHRDYARALRATALFAERIVFQDGALWCYGPVFNDLHTLLQDGYTPAQLYRVHPLLQGFSREIIAIGRRTVGSFSSAYHSATAVASGFQVVPAEIGTPVVNCIEKTPLLSGASGPVEVFAPSAIIDDLPTRILDRMFDGGRSPQAAIDDFQAAIRSIAADDPQSVPAQAFAEYVLGKVYEECVNAQDQRVSAGKPGITYFRRGVIEEIVSCHKSIRKALEHTADNLKEPIPNLYKRLQNASDRDLLAVVGLAILRMISFHYQSFQADNLSALVRSFNPLSNGNDRVHWMVNRGIRTATSDRCPTQVRATVPQDRLLQFVRADLPWERVSQARELPQFTDFMNRVHEFLACSDPDAFRNRKDVQSDVSSYLKGLERLNIIDSAEEAEKRVWRTPSSEWPYGGRIRIMGIVGKLLECVPVAGPFLGTMFREGMFVSEFERIRRDIVMEASFLDAVRPN